MSECALSYLFCSDDLPDTLIEQWALDDVGMDYHVVSAFGTRGCGKSKYTSSALFLSTVLTMPM